MNLTNKKKLRLKLCHQIKINYEGVRTKRADEEEFSEWRGISYCTFRITFIGRDALTGSSIEPISLLNSLPDTPHILDVPQFTSDRIQKLAETFGSETKVLEVLSEFTDIPSYACLDAVDSYITSASYTPLPAATNPTIEVRSDDHISSIEVAAVPSEENNEHEIRCTSISQCRWNVELNAPEWLTYYSGIKRV